MTTLDQIVQHLGCPDHRYVRRLADPQDFFLQFSQALKTTLHRQVATGNHDSADRKLQGFEQNSGKVGKPTLGLNFHHHSGVFASQRQQTLAKGADILVMDSGAIVYEGESQKKGARRREGGGKHAPAHASMEDVARMAAEAGAKKLVLHHFRPGTVDEKRTLRAMRSIYRGEIVFAEDMQAIR